MHTWRECDPTTVASHAEQLTEKMVRRVWGMLSDTQRQDLHAFCCENIVNARTAAAVRQIGNISRAALGAEREGRPVTESDIEAEMV